MSQFVSHRSSPSKNMDLHFNNTNHQQNNNNGGNYHAFVTHQQHQEHVQHQPIVGSPVHSPPRNYHGPGHGHNLEGGGGGSNNLFDGGSSSANYDNSGGSGSGRYNNDLHQHDDNNSHHNHHHHFDVNMSPIPHSTTTTATPPTAMMATTNGAVSATNQAEATAIYATNRSNPKADDQRHHRDDNQGDSNNGNCSKNNTNTNDRTSSKELCNSKTTNSVSSNNINWEQRLSISEQDLKVAKQTQISLQEQIKDLQQRKIDIDSHITKLENDISVAQLEIPCQWNVMFKKLLDYREEHGNTLVPHSNKTNPELNSLGRFVGNQRVFYKYYINGDKKHIKKYRIDALNRIGFVWNVKDYIFETHLKTLEDYISENGNSMVPRKYPTNQSFSTWIQTQRIEYNKYKRGVPTSLTPKRIKQLNDLQFSWTNNAGSNAGGGSNAKKRKNKKGKTDTSPKSALESDGGMKGASEKAGGDRARKKGSLGRKVLAESDDETSSSASSSLGDFGDSDSSIGTSNDDDDGIDSQTKSRRGRRRTTRSNAAKQRKSQSQTTRAKSKAKKKQSGGSKHRLVNKKKLPTKHEKKRTDADADMDQTVTKTAENGARDKPSKKVKSSSSPSVSTKSRSSFAGKSGEEIWNIKYSRLKEFYDLYGHVRVNQRNLIDEAKTFVHKHDLISWVSYQRRQQLLFLENQKLQSQQASQNEENGARDDKDDNDIQAVFLHQPYFTQEKIDKLNELEFPWKKPAHVPRKNTATVIPSSAGTGGGGGNADGNTDDFCQGGNNNAVDENGVPARIRKRKRSSTKAAVAAASVAENPAEVVGTETRTSTSAASSTDIMNFPGADESSDSLIIREGRGGVDARFDEDSLLMGGATSTTTATGEDDAHHHDNDRDSDNNDRNNNASNVNEDDQTISVDGDSHTNDHDRFHDSVQF